MPPHASDAPKQATSRSRLPRFFVDGVPTDESVELAPGEETHARRVLRLGSGERVLGMDGAGASWLLELKEGRGARLVETFELAPGPGSAGAPLPWIEMAVAWPKKSLGESMLNALCQLGAAAITPLRAHWSGSSPVPDDPPDRWRKIAREACKQSERLWLPNLGPAASVTELVKQRPEAVMALLDPHKGMSLDTWVRSVQPKIGGVGSQVRPIVLAIGPEGGFDEEERGVMHKAGATSVQLAPHILRIETAALAALTVCVTGWM